MVSVLFVCLGNICRSPAAEAILIEKARSANHDIVVASCGMGDWHVGQLPNERMQHAASKRGLVLASRAQRFREEFFDNYDYILAADSEVLQGLYHYAKSPQQKGKVELMMHFSDRYDATEVPDPFYGGDADFELVLDMLEDACDGLVSHLISSTDQQKKPEI